METEIVNYNPYNELLKLSQSERVKLSQRVIAWDGTIRLFVHPSFFSANHHQKVLEHFPGHEETEQGVRRLLALEEDRTPPLVIMEEHKHLKSAEQSFRHDAKQKAYFIETDDSDPALYNDPNGFSKLADSFAEIGVKKIIVGGQVLWIDTNELQDAGNLKIPERYGYEDQSPWVGGCTGKVIRGLNDDRFTIEISNLSYPDKLSKLENILS